MNSPRNRSGKSKVLNILLKHCGYSGKEIPIAILWGKKTKPKFIFKSDKITGNKATTIIIDELKNI